MSLTDVSKHAPKIISPLVSTVDSVIDCIVAGVDSEETGEKWRAGSLIEHWRFAPPLLNKWQEMSQSRFAFSFGL